MSELLEKTTFILPLEIKKTLYKTLFNLRKRFLKILKENSLESAAYLKTLLYLSKTLKTLSLPIIIHVFTVPSEKETSTGLGKGLIFTDNSIGIEISLNILSLVNNEDDWIGFCKAFIAAVEHEYIHIQQELRDERQVKIETKPYYTNPKELSALSSNVIDELLDYFSIEDVLPMLSANFDALLDYSKTLFVLYFEIGPKAKSFNKKAWKTFLLFLESRIRALY